ncbi:HesB/IscA family protein [Pseudogracilibacillus auburnensis]|uniref:Iron-sulfur cluster assembly protein n=1 Tax=Pseudogracilibacillus auburnensis TaxID=1494959 RepID=A0A2V3VXY7_9BACI|nr:iron-sulfur cluster assembly accessory protein [Pseudogracilibacillus auburnensis]MBO1005000.1 iron-sulfur cluster assembly accessory protein [Pseudogracilibacillus auburnensis]PXW81429.1 iron-sulfur cluster assembly protein [Pseudogracilibacillus auburnensis]
MVIKITDDARQQIKEMLKNESKESRLRFGVKGGGCSGLSYSLGFDDEVNEELDMIDEINEIPFVISKLDIPIIENTEIDFKQNMMGGGFSINNPNAIISCGCGSSFRTKDKVGTPGDC